jgi:hypothetical protein
VAEYQKRINSVLSEGLEVIKENQAATIRSMLDSAVKSISPQKFNPCEFSSARSNPFGCSELITYEMDGHWYCKRGNHYARMLLKNHPDQVKKRAPKAKEPEENPDEYESDFIDDEAEEVELKRKASKGKTLRNKVAKRRRLRGKKWRKKRRERKWRVKRRVKRMMAMCKRWKFHPLRRIQRKGKKNWW